MADEKEQPLVVSLFIVLVVVAIAAAIAFALGQDGVTGVGDLPVVYGAALLAFGINWVAFVPAFVQRTEHFYDLTGGLTYLSVTGFALATAGAFDVRSLVVAAMVSVWAIRLASFLFLRVKRVGKDGRFDSMKQSFGRFLVAWTLQGLWVFLTLAAALAILTTEARPPLGVFDAVGFGIWALGFGIEIVADRQKSAFKKDPDNDGRFINTGLWAWSRHPNYFGEILLWVGVAVMSVSVLSGWGYVALVSPVFVVLLLTQVSGVPLLEERSDRRWGGQDDYEAYKANTPVLVLRPPRRG